MKKPLPIDVIDKNAQDSDVRYCCHVSCNENGSYPAPKSRLNMRQRYWFCLQHVREYNASWNYFNGMDEEQILSFQKDALTGHRPTWASSIHAAAREERLRNKLATDFFHAQTRAEVPKIPATEREALAVMNLVYPVTKLMIKKRYKELVKKFHPDVCQQEANAEEKFVAISSAYQLLISSNYFTS